MERYKFDEKYIQKIVNAIVDGYRDYIEHRQECHEKMIISSAFAWTKGNFIESKIAKVGERFNLSHKKAKAGLTWDYLKFIQEEKKILFLVRNSAYFNPNNFSQAVLPTNRKSKHQRTYLHELSKINSKLAFPSRDKLQNSPNHRVVQLAFPVLENKIIDELNEFQTEYNEFHILTYKIDSAYQISEIMHYLPNPTNNIAYEIENLSDYISGAELTQEEQEVVAPDLVATIIDPEAFDIQIISDEESK